MELTFRIEHATHTEGPFAASYLWKHRVYTSAAGARLRPGPRSFSALARFLWREGYRFGCYSVPNLRHWFPRSVVPQLERDGFEIVVLRAPVAAKAGRQVVLRRDRAEVIARLPVDLLHQKGALESVVTNVSED